MSVSSGCSEAISSLMSSTVDWVTVFSSSGRDSLLSADIKEEAHASLCCSGESGMGYSLLLNASATSLCFHGLWMMSNWYPWISIAHLASRPVARF